jgi:hypothetical protein
MADRQIGYDRLVILLLRHSGQLPGRDSPRIPALVSSGRYRHFDNRFLVLWLFVVNLAAIAGGILLLLRSLGSRIGASNPRSHKFIVVPAAALLLASVVASEVFVLSIGVWRPTSSLFYEVLHCSELRPVFSGGHEMIRPRLFGSPK